jgi:hypothetical protein
MKFEPTTIAAAFEQHRQRYTEKWPLDHHVELWQLADSAFGKPSADDFQQLYDALAKIWKAMRRATGKWDAGQAFKNFTVLDDHYAQKKLSELRSEDKVPLWSLIKSVEGLKVNRYSSSVVAISKFLHFWNPRLFVIVDDAVMWNHVFDRWWLWDSFKRTREQIDDAATVRADVACDLSSYLAVLFWCSRILRENPLIMSEFDKYIGPDRISALPQSRSYEAAAVEWFLLGVAELPPAGVVLD